MSNLFFFFFFFDILRFTGVDLTWSEELTKFGPTVSGMQYRADGTYSLWKVSSTQEVTIVDGDLTIGRMRANSLFVLHCRDTHYKDKEAYVCDDLYLSCILVHCTVTPASRSKYFKTSLVLLQIFCKSKDELYVFTGTDPNLTYVTKLETQIDRVQQNLKAKIIC